MTLATNSNKCVGTVIDALLKQDTIGKGAALLNQYKDFRQSSIADLQATADLANETAMKLTGPEFNAFIDARLQDIANISGMINGSLDSVVAFSQALQLNNQAFYDQLNETRAIAEQTMTSDNEMRLAIFAVLDGV